MTISSVTRAVAGSECLMAVDGALELQSLLPTKGLWSHYDMVRYPCALIGPARSPSSRLENEHIIGDAIGCWSRMLRGHRWVSGVTSLLPTRGLWSHPYTDLQPQQQQRTTSRSHQSSQPTPETRCPLFFSISSERSMYHRSHSRGGGIFVAD
uniref:Uncharacterized protein n=1 Tax=Mesocestoides corti TaxID=53468 RepID=A0A5K3EUV3_MESCO